MAIDTGYETLDECAEFMRTVDITPESLAEYQSREAHAFERMKLPGHNLGVIIRIYNEGMYPGQRVEVVNADWRKLKADGLVAIISAQRQQAIHTEPANSYSYANSRWDDNVIYYGIPVRKASEEPSPQPFEGRI